MTSKLMTACVALALMGCGSTIPDSNPNARGVGFGDYNEYSSQRAARDAQLEARISTEEVAASESIAEDTAEVLSATESAETPSVAVTSIESSNPSISDEQDFDAVSSRETIESDRDRLARQRETFSVAQPEAVPSRPSGRAAPNIVSFALATNNAVGQSVYDRPNRFNEDRYRRACADFGSSDQAQAAFLAAGGPERDRRGLDPDGDGFACFWDPTPFRAARGG
ncbi:MAG: hypothetical protein AAFY31_17745 [Pseudomonadota bacterium]